MPRRYLFTLILIAIVFIGAIVLLTALLSGGGDESANDTPLTQQRTKEFTKDAQKVIYTTYGPVVGDDQKRGIRITISAQERVVEILSGYDERVEKDKYQYNTQTAFNDFLVALESVGFNRYDPNYDVDPRSQCVTGKRYSYGIDYFDFEDVYTWSNSCSDKQGNFRGNARLVEDLMQDQITDYSDFVSGVSL